jgi:drug/metabolite transporter (DMT)-like permease
MMRKAISFSLLTAFVSGVSVFANGVFVTKIDPVAFAFIRNACVAVLLTGIVLYSGQAKQLKKLSRSQWLKLIAIGAIGGGIPFALFFSGLAQIGAVNGTIIHKSMFLWVALLAVPILGETMSWLTVVGYGILFGATFALGGKFSFVPSIGSAMVLGATLLWAIEQIVAKRILSSVSPTFVSWARMVFGLPFLFGWLAFSGSLKFLTLSTLHMSLVPVAVSSVLLGAYMLTWYQALKRAPATLVSSVLVLAPLVTIALQSGFFHKPIQLGQIQSLIVAAIGVFFVALPILKRQRSE